MSEYKTIYMIRHGRSMGNLWDGAYKDDRMNFLADEGEIQAKALGHRLLRHNIEVDEWHVSELTRTRQTLALALGVMDDWRREDIFIHQELNENHFWGDSDEGPLRRSKIQEGKVREWTQKVIRPFLITPDKEIGSGPIRYVIPWKSIGIVSHYFTMKFLFDYFMREYNFDKYRIYNHGEHIENGEIYRWEEEKPDQITILR